MKNLKKITVDGTTYLGTITNNVITGTANINYEVYLKKKAKGGLVTVTVGDSWNLITTELTETEKLDCKRIKSLWKLAKKQTMAHVTCQVFEELLGKSKSRLQACY